MPVIDTQGSYDLTSTFTMLSMAAGDPCLRMDSPERLRLALHTPAGPAAVVFEHRDNGIHAETLGDGGDWLIEFLPALLGVGFQPPEFDGPAKLRTIAKRFQGMRIPVLPAITLRLAQLILQQLISFKDACSGWRNLVRRFGTPVPDQDGLWFPPKPEVLRRLVSHQFIECDILPQHGRRIVEVMRYGRKLEQIWNAGRDPEKADEVCEVLEKVRGIGPWTIGFLRGAGLGDGDAVVVGDYGHPKHVSYFFNGRENPDADDAEMLRLLEPCRPHRYYTLSLLILGAPAPPRRSPRGKRLRDRFR